MVVEFEFKCMDEIPPTACRGWAIIEGDTLNGMIFSQQMTNMGLRRRREEMNGGGSNSDHFPLQLHPAGRKAGIAIRPERTLFDRLGVRIRNSRRI